MRVSTIKGFSGIDQRADFVKSLGVASDMRNLRVTDGGSLVKRNGEIQVWTAPERIEYIWSGSLNGEELIVLAADSKLYKLRPNSIPASSFTIGYIGSGKCFIFQFGGILYIKTETTYHKYDGNRLTAVEGYIPLVALSCKPSGEGEIFEQINLICDKRRQLFSPAGNAMVYKLAEDNISDVHEIKLNGVTISVPFELDKEKGQIQFMSPPPEGTNSLEIIYSKTNDADFKKRIFGCRKMMLFGGNSDGRIFLWGNEDHPNHRFHSELADGVPSAEYFPVNGFTIIGNSRINCIVQQYDKQLIFTDREAFYSYCELKTDSLGNVYSSFPVFSLNNGKGCIIETEGCVMNNRPVTLCSDGLNMWESTAVVNEKNAICFSDPIQNSMKEILNSDLSGIKLFDFQANRELFFIHDKSAYIYNYGNGSWYRYDKFPIDCYSVYGNLLYFARKDRLFVFGNELEYDLEGVGYWESAYMDGGHSSGACDLVRFEADMHIKGLECIRFEFKRSGEQYLSQRELEYPEGTDKYMRISIRPFLKRALPFKITFTDNGPGKCVLHGITFKTRNKERSHRHGLL